MAVRSCWTRKTHARDKKKFNKQMNTGFSTPEALILCDISEARLMITGQFGRSDSCLRHACMMHVQCSTRQNTAYINSERDVEKSGRQEKECEKNRSNCFEDENMKANNVHRLRHHHSVVLRRSLNSFACQSHPGGAGYGHAACVCRTAFVAAPLRWVSDA